MKSLRIKLMLMCCFCCRRWSRGGRSASNRASRRPGRWRRWRERGAGSASAWRRAVDSSPSTAATRCVTCFDTSSRYSYLTSFSNWSSSASSTRDRFIFPATPGNISIHGRHAPSPLLPFNVTVWLHGASNGRLVVTVADMYLCVVQTYHIMFIVYDVHYMYVYVYMNASTKKEKCGVNVHCRLKHQ